MHPPEDTFNPTILNVLQIINTLSGTLLSVERNEINHLAKHKEPQNLSYIYKDDSLLIHSRSFYVFGGRVWLKWGKKRFEGSISSGVLGSFKHCCFPGG